ncbi:uncharacterized protein LOC119270443 isoform X1 [Triticum dicoccoides]|uniref:uncharacterized protein n=1 Tax=Triticum aestivum TaxID=4565 RepID=UPI00188E15B2|nr:uncharacterized protein LOC119270443 isoform X1 [Triticum dicoccoides]XP_044343162.1 uncharacterized protein LOC123063442 [Triticum aestivum]XP_044343163.1 uncharacterized protein LOC123063442 [Triticum aestivum]
MTRSSATPPSSPRRRAPPPIVPLQLIQSRPPESLAAGHKYLTVALCFSTGAAYVHLGSSCRTQRSLVAHIRWSAHRLNSIRLQPCSGQSGTKMKSSVFFSLNSTYQIQLRVGNGRTQYSKPNGFLKQNSMQPRGRIAATRMCTHSSECQDPIIMRMASGLGHGRLGMEPFGIFHSSLCIY